MKTIKHQTIFYYNFKKLVDTCENLIKIRKINLSGEVNISIDKLNQQRIFIIRTIAYTLPNLTYNKFICIWMNYSQCKNNENILNCKYKNEFIYQSKSDWYLYKHNVQLLLKCKVI
ncbi:hypothetical protein QLL95_gp0599 [Cotonvirus japonicus]|uniref:Uncharacterized protein n=1 Tax=Cotonvirus japonicus TaxID=2811091 RepID=A0ABM7NTN3_9VIRU|nr:hypothetical protein QLL95_gp0599 [Cotonvirus japonicus]BCS83524.1 hypothetical protein [Cotonvirus japonicus]